MRTQEEINRQIDGLKSMKSWLPETSGFGIPNWQKIDAQISILNGDETLEDFDAGDWEEMDDDNKVYRAAEDAEQWLDGDSDEDLFEERLNPYH